MSLLSGSFRLRLSIPKTCILILTVVKSAVFHTPLSDYSGVMSFDFFAQPYLIISSSLSEMPATPMKCSISCAKVFPCSSRRLQVRACRFCEKSSSFPHVFGRAYLFPKNLSSAKHYFPIAPETRSQLTGSDTAEKKSQKL